MGAVTTSPTVTATTTATEQSIQIPNNRVFVIGQTIHESTFNDGTHTQQTQRKGLRKSKINTSVANITHIESGHAFTIYYDDKHQICHISGASPLVCSMNHFKIHDIQLNSVFISVSNPNSITFCVSSDGRVVYGCSKSMTHTKSQLGLNITDHVTHGKPSIIPGLTANHKTIMSIRTARYYSIALCSYSKYANIITYWTRTCTNHGTLSTPKAVTKIIIMYYSLNALYSTGIARYGGHCDGVLKKRSWSEILFFENQNARIVKIATGSYHTLCLDSDGHVWAAGNNDYGQLGLGHFKTNGLGYPKSIKYFVRYRVRVKHICCGHSHNLAIDCDKRLYTWGNSEHGQTGHGTARNVNKPKIVEFFKKKKHKIVSIECGTWHSCACNDKNEYFLWGSNVHHECMDDNKQIVVLPQCINGIVQKETNYQYIRGISLGNGNTKVIVSNHIAPTKSDDI
eukprot:356618_1